METRRSGSRRAPRLAFAALLWALALVTAFAMLADESPADEPRLDPYPSATELDTTSRVDPLFSRVVSSLAGRRARVHCWSRAGWRKRAAEWAARWPYLGTLGPWRAYSFRRSATVHLSPAVCAELERFVKSPEPASRSKWPYALAWSVGALAHESVHAGGIESEIKATCFGMQSIEEAAVELGRTRAEGRYLAALYWRFWYLLFGSEVRSPECRDGGRLDRDSALFWP